MNKTTIQKDQFPDTAVFFRTLKTDFLGRELWAFNSLDSTSSLLKSMPPESTPEGLVCIAGEQYEGRGQHQKKWLSNSGNGLHFSFVLKDGEADRLQLLLQCFTYAILNTLKKLYSVNGVLKWPNDVMVGGRKISGVIAECAFLGKELERMIIGIGLNTNGKLRDEVSDIAINLETILEHKVDHAQLLAELLGEIEQQYARWLNHDPELIVEINKHHRGYGEWNQVEANGKILDGRFKFLGLDLNGFPVFLNEDDEVKRITQTDIRFVPVSKPA